MKSTKVFHMGGVASLLIAIAAIVSLQSFNPTDSNAQCSWMPAGVSTTPAWTQASNPISLEWKPGCFMEYEYCYRINSNNEFEIIISSRRQIFGPGCNTPQVVTRRGMEMLQDYVVGAIAVEINPTEANDLDPCPTTSNNTYRIMSSNCKTEFYYDFTRNNGDYVSYPCSVDGYCIYEYKYCYIMDDGEKKSTFERNVQTYNGNQCPDDYTDPTTQVDYDCFPDDCYPPRTSVKVVELTDLWNDDETYYDRYKAENIGLTW